VIDQLAQAGAEGWGDRQRAGRAFWVCD
jgi:hypothetical protein